MQPFVLMLYEIIYESKFDNVLEIGVRQGQSSRTILSALFENQCGLLTSVDLGDRTERIYPHLLPFWENIVGDSHKQNTLDAVKDKEYDLLLIDGDHTYEGVKLDYKMYSPLVKEGGYIFFHDVINKDCGVPKFWEELDVKNKITFPYGVAGMGLIQK